MESMNNKDPFESFLEKQSFSEKASDSLRSRLEKSASWNRPWWKNPTTLAFMAACLIVVVSFLLLIVARSQIKPAVVPVAEQMPVFEEPLTAPPQVIAQNGKNSPLSPFQRHLEDNAPEFNLSFIDRPVNYMQARREYSDFI